MSVSSSGSNSYYNTEGERLKLNKDEAEKYDLDNKKTKGDKPSVSEAVSKVASTSLSKDNAEVQSSDKEINPFKINEWNPRKTESINSVNESPEYDLGDSDVEEEDDKFDPDTKSVPTHENIDVQGGVVTWRSEEDNPKDESDDTNKLSKE